MKDNRMFQNNEVSVTPLCRPVSPVALAVLAVLWLLLNAGSAAAKSDIQPPVESLAQITFDDDSNRLQYPAAVFYDPYMEEIYAINGGSGRVVVYGPDFFPRNSIGAGQGVLTPRGGIVAENGEVYICQIRTKVNPNPRITILNSAFFVDREIDLTEIPEARDFIPKQLAVNRDGLIYLAGNDHREVLVLDGDGNFLRRLQPIDEVYSRNLAQDLGRKEPEGTADEKAKASEELKSPEEDKYADIPEEFRPRNSNEADAPLTGKTMGPVKVNYVTIDSTGKIYLVSAETGKIYVFGPDESFLFSFGQKGGSPGQMSQPRATAVDEERELIYVVDYMRHTILAYDFSGTYLFEINGRGTKPGWFNFPTGIVLNSQGQLVVADLFNRRVQVLDVKYEEIEYILKGEGAAEAFPEIELDTEYDPDREEQTPDQSDEPNPPGDEASVSGDKGENAFEVIIQEELPPEDNDVVEAPEGGQDISPLPSDAGSSQ